VARFVTLDGLASCDVDFLDILSRNWLLGEVQQAPLRAVERNALTDLFSSEWMTDAGSISSIPVESAWVGGSMTPTDLPLPSVNPARTRGSKLEGSRSGPKEVEYDGGSKCGYLMG
jgi:hypothetical protein